MLFLMGLHFNGANASHFNENFAPEDPEQGFSGGDAVMGYRKPHSYSFTTYGERRPQTVERHHGIPGPMSGGTHVEDTILVGKYAGVPQVQQRLTDYHLRLGTAADDVPLLPPDNSPDEVWGAAFVDLC